MVGHRRMATLPAMSLIAIVISVAACGGGSSGASDGGSGSAGTGGGGTTGGGGGTSGGTPVALCKELISTFCSRSDSCQGIVGTPQEQADCEKFENVEFGCDRAASTGFPACLSDVKLLSCTALFNVNGLNLPQTCEEPLNTIPLSAAQMKCAELAHTICQKIFKCDGTTPTTAELSACDSEAFFEIQCNFVVDVGPTIDQCIADFPNSTCPSLPDAGTDGGMMTTVPSCMGVIKGPT